MNSIHSVALLLAAAASLGSAQQYDAPLTDVANAKIRYVQTRGSSLPIQYQTVLDIDYSARRNQVVYQEVRVKAGVRTVLDSSTVSLSARERETIRSRVESAKLGLRRRLDATRGGESQWVVVRGVPSPYAGITGGDRSVLRRIRPVTGLLRALDAVQERARTALTEAFETLKLSYAPGVVFTVTSKGKVAILKRYRSFAVRWEGTGSLRLADIVDLGERLEDVARARSQNPSQYNAGPAVGPSFALQATRSPLSGQVVLGHLNYIPDPSLRGLVSTLKKIEASMLNGTFPGGVRARIVPYSTRR